MLTNKPNSSYGLSPMFTGVRLGCRQNCRQHQLILAVERARQRFPASRSRLFPGLSTTPSDSFKETDHLLGGIWPLGISVGALRVATRPRMARLLNYPFLHD